MRGRNARNGEKKMERKIKRLLDFWEDEGAVSALFRVIEVRGGINHCLPPNVFATGLR
jgi:hypothetical protein